jgi:AraC-like DNA-binding protein
MNERRESDVSQAGGFGFCRYRPGVALSPFVRNYWTVRPAGASETVRRQRVVPDGCIDIIFVRHSPTESFKACVVGTMTRPIFAELTIRTEYLGIRFAPGGFRHFFATPAGELTDRIVPLEDLSVSFLPAERVADSSAGQARLRLVEDALARRLPSDGQGPIPAKVLEMISARGGMITVAQLADLAGWSPRHLGRMVHESVGVAPKTFCRIMRFKSALRALRRRPKPTLLQVALEAGYYDQAHFIHDFKRFYGASPSAVFKDPAF